MQKLVTVLTLVFATSVSAQGLTRDLKKTPEQLVGSVYVGAAVTVQTYGGHKLPADQGVTVTSVTAYVSVVSGGGASNTVFRISDGSNNCDATITCASTQSTGSKRIDGASLSGTCSFAAGSALTFAVQSSGCTTSQPAIKQLEVNGVPLT